MNAVFAIALLSLRSALRSRMVTTLVALLVAIMVFLPMLIKGDGTMAGFIHLLLSYSLGLASMVIAMTLLWAGSFAVSAEIQEKTIHVLATKPVTRFHIWAGKWLGLNILGLLLIGFCGLTTYGLLHLHLRSDRWTDAQRTEADRLLTARAELLPTTPDFGQLARQQVSAQPFAPETAVQANIDQQIQAKRQQLIAAFFTVPANGRNQWTFPPFTTAPGDRTVILRYRFSSSMIDQESVSGRWLIGTREQPDLIDITRSQVPRTWSEVEIPYRDSWANEELLITFINTDTNGASLLFDLDQGLTLRAPAGGFAANYLRVLLVKLGRMSFLSALGVTAGCLFSLPVAALIAMYTLLLVQLAPHVRAMAAQDIAWTSPEGGGNPPFGLFLIMVYKALAFLLGPLTEGDELTRLAQGLTVTWNSAAYSLLLPGTLYALLLGAFASYILNRRELALPSS